jgi:hypothetical protein
MYLVQLLLPIYDNDKRAFPRAYFDQVRHELTHRFGGITSFVRSPAEGLWKESEHEVTRDDVVMFEVMAEYLDDGWWKRYRQKLETSFRQDNIVVRALEVTKL